MESASRSCRVHNLDLKREAVSALVFVQILAYVAYTRLIWNLCLSGKSAIQHALHSHYRAITDINWHTQDPNVVVSTGIDSWLWAWDLRTPKKPIMGQSIYCHVLFLSDGVFRQAFVLLMVCVLTLSQPR